ncbi:MAG: RNA methyltransferase [Planctomycetota bacterium]
MDRQTRIESVANPRLKRTLKLRKPRERRAAGLLLAEGRREVERAFASGLACRELWTCRDLLGEDFPLSRRADQVYAATPTAFRKLAWHDEPEGVLGVFEAPGWTLAKLPPPEAADMYLVAVGTEKPGNLGAMVRTAAAAGCRAVLAVGPSVDVFNPAAIRNSTGAVFALPVAVVPDAADAIDWLADRGVSIVAAVAPGQSGRSCFEADWAFPAAVVVGPEHAGLDAVWRDRATVLATIPMLGDGDREIALNGIPPTSASVDSLNASNAAAVMLYEAVRRRLTLK